MGAATAVKLRPLDDRVVIKPAEQEETTAGGIVLPANAQEKQQKGEVVAAGPGKLLDSGDRAPLSVQVGDQVIFGKYAGSDLKVGDDEVKILRESEILGKIVG